jgi:hypothetical protein
MGTYSEPRQRELLQAIAPRDAGVLVEASGAQYEIWLHNEAAGGLPIYNEAFALTFAGELKIPALENALTCVVNRHEAWRTAFQWRDGRLMQVVAREVDIRLTIADLTRFSPQRRERHAQELCRSDISRPFEAARVPLFRARLIRLGKQEYRLLIVVHHLICDGFSIYQVFLPELYACYAAYSTDSMPSLPALQFQYPDYCLWQGKQLTKVKIDSRLRYWQRQLAGHSSSMALRQEGTCPSKRNYKGGVEPFSVSLKVTEDLKRLALTGNATLFMTLLAAFNVLLYHESGLCDQLIGSVTSGRPGNGTERLLGTFVNTTAFRVTFGCEDSFEKLLKEVREVVLDSLSNEVPFRLLINHLGKERQLGVNPLTEVMFSFEPPMTTSLPRDWTYTKMCSEDLSKFDLNLQIGEQPTGLIGQFTYRRDVFETVRITTMNKNWIALLSLIVSDPQESIASLVKRLTFVCTRASDVDLSAPSYMRICGYWLRKMAELTFRSKSK